MMKRVAALAWLVLACASPVPEPGPTGASSDDGSSPVPTSPAHAPLRPEAALALDVEPDQLLLVEDGFVAALFRDAETLELVWIGPVGEQLEERLLAAVPEQRADPSEVSAGSVNAAVCPDDLGLARTRYLFGQETLAQDLVLSGVPSVGGAVSAGTYVFAIGGQSFDASSRWLISNESGQDLVSFDGSWLVLPPEASPGSCSITSEH